MRARRSISLICEASGSGGHGHLRRSLILRECLRDTFGTDADLHVIAPMEDAGVLSAAAGWTVRIHPSLDSFLLTALDPMAVLHMDFAFPDAGGSLPHDAIMALRAKGQTVTAFSDQLRIDLCVDAAFSHVAYCTGLTHGAALSGTQLYMGPSYYPVRRQDVADAMAQQAGDNVLIMFGGTDAGQLTETVAQGARDAGIGPLLVVFGAGAVDQHRRAENLRTAGFTVRVAPDNILAVIRTCRAAIVAGGNQLYDLAIMGVQAYAVPLTGRQSLNVAAMATHGTTEGLERPLSAERFRVLAEQIAKQSKGGKIQIDHDGARCVCAVLMDLAHRNAPTQGISSRVVHS